MPPPLGSPSSTPWYNQPFSPWALIYTLRIPAPPFCYTYLFTCLLGQTIGSLKAPTLTRSPFYNLPHSRRSASTGWLKKRQAWWCLTKYKVLYKHKVKILLSLARFPTHMVSVTLPSARLGCEWVRRSGCLGLGKGGHRPRRPLLNTKTQLRGSPSVNVPPAK